jgi:hypothetical protein
VATFILSTSGWSPVGFGSPNANPSGYLVAPWVDVLGLVFGPYGALWVYLSIVGSACAAGGWLLARAIAGRDPIAAPAAATIATFNPWVYNKIVAAHTYMLLAYAVLAVLLAMIVMRSNLTSVRAALLATVAYAQLQFFVIVCAVLAIAAVRRRRWLAIGTAVVVALPTAIGILGEFGALSRTPITVPWETSQSVQPLQAAALVGYFADYATQFEGWGAVPVVLLALIALAGTFFGRSSRNVWLLALATIATILIASGTHGPFGAPFAELVRRTPLVGLYRELYDLIGLVAIGYIALALVAARRFRVAIFALAAIALSLAGLWISAPPARYFVDARSLPRIALVGAPGERFALEPAFQPLRFEGRGSGPDPDAGLRLDGRSSLNEYVPSYPVDAALAAYQQSGDARQLAALGVAEIIRRPGYTTDAPSLRAQLGDLAQPAGRDREAQPTSAAPLVGLEAYPRHPALVPELGSGEMFFPDVAGGDSIRLEHPSNASLDAAAAWVDTRLETIAHPAFASPLGGAFTESAATLPVDRNERFVLAAVAGRLVATDGRELVRSPVPRYEWLQLPANVNGFRCEGRCAVAAFTTTLPSASATSIAAQRALVTRSLAPWLIETATVTETEPDLLRFNARYDPAWQAFAGTRLLAHVRVDATSNGWLVPSGTTGRIVLIDAIAAAQASAETFGALWTLALIIAVFRRRAVFQP